MRLRYKVWLETEGKAFGEGPLKILRKVDELGSLSKTARELNMSYSKAWKLINFLEKNLGFKLLQREAGGSGGGGSYLTAEARALMQKYENFSLEADQALQNLFHKYFG